MVDESEESNKLSTYQSKLINNLDTYIEIFSLYDELIRLANKEKEENVTIKKT